MCNEGFVCSPNKFLCKTLGQFVCVPKERRCDGHIDCDDAVDEKNCTRPQTCSEKEFTCLDRAQCIPVALRCDGKRDCVDGSDEDWLGCPSETPCPMGQFACKRALEGSVTCFPRALLCDGHKQCHDGSDEIGCGNRICEAGEFRCKTGRCIPQQWTCDGKPDCPDGLDEDALLCKAYGSLCPSSQLPCRSHNGSFICIGEEEKCNGHVDCDDGSDERLNCARLAFNCRGSHFRCDNGRCVPKPWKCDGVDDCFDGSDEKGCASTNDELSENCSVNEFSCSTGSACIPLNLRCDRHPDCPDESDEHGCPSEISNFV
ncbi:hypothetical protein HPB49_000360 [Dermacentor silvarum]|uniref:Uncharacterized protein n=2 Tax=Dermacentor silvarum TaxID=543639 RepID=A0ACB8DLH9_DERSI|nr:hypothetical protein HPB49_000360 [Dermacentor silvarum]